MPVSIEDIGFLPTLPASDSATSPTGITPIDGGYNIPG